MIGLNCLATALGWLGRHGTLAVAVSMFVGIALPPLGALFRPYFSESVIVLLVLAFLRVDPQKLREQWSNPGLTLAAAGWSMLALPMLCLLMLAGLGAVDFQSLQRSPGLLLSLTLHAVAPPTFSSPSLAALIGLNGAISLAVLIVSTAATPFTSPALVAAFFGPDVTLSPLSLGLRLLLILAGSALASFVIHTLLGRGFIERQAERIDGLSVIALFGFAIALMGDVLGNAVAHPLLVLGLIALATSVSLALSAITVLVFWRAGPETALTLGHSAGSRNMGLMLAAAAGSVPELVWLYVALAQFPIYLLPLPFRPLVRKLTTRT
jgi:BASS family bile acid:Na+ symporter